jgi:hypothetical protein
MSRPRVTAPVLGAALLVLMAQVFLPLAPPSAAAIRSAPRSSQADGAAPVQSAAGQTSSAWQRHVTLSSAAHQAAPTGSRQVAGIDGAWTLLPPPELRESPSIYDPVRESMLFFGGTADNGGSSNALWELSLAGVPTWSQLVTTGTPPPARSTHSLLYDSRRERMLVFGGADAITRNDFWVLDLSVSPPAWSQGLPGGTLPPARGYAQAVYDSLDDRVVIFGGATDLGQNGPPTGMLADAWVLPFAGPFVWTALTPSGAPPSARAAGAALYDPIRQRMVVFGGYDGSALNDAFTLSLDVSPAWAPLVTTGGPPPPRAIPGTIYEAPQDRMVIFGGFTGGSANDVWALDLATSAWSELLPIGGPPSPRQGPAAVYDAPRDRMVSFGGSDTTGVLPDPFWSLSLGPLVEWTDLGGHHPPQRWNAATAFDESRRVMWVHGGDAFDNNGRATRSDLWSFPMGFAGGWSQPATLGSALGRRFAHSAIYDALRDRLIFFGGNDTTTNLNDVWALQFSVPAGLTQLLPSDTPIWNQMFPTGTPPSARSYHSAVYDALHDRMVVFGGNSGQNPLNDTWELAFVGGQGAVWSQILPTGTPPPQLSFQSAALDRDANRLIIFGGDAGGPRNNVYALTLNGSPVWTELLPTGLPPTPRHSAAMVSLGTRMLVFGGSDNGFVGTDDTWLLSLYPPSWRQLDVGSLLPSARLASSAVFDQATFRLAIFGGTGGFNSGGDTWIQQLDQVVSTLASLVSANVGEGRVDLAWQLSSSVASARVYRSAEDGVWTELGNVVPDGTGRLAYVDFEVIAGARYGYRLGLTKPGGESFAGEVWVDVPTDARFALRGMTPNPGPVGEGLVAFSLPDAAPARLEVVDVAGRKQFTREVGALGRGEHFLRVGGAEPLAPGLYMVRLTRGERSLTTKAVMIR